MPKISLSDVVYALGHPLRALRYLRHRDTISYETCARYLPANPVIIEAGAYDGSNTRDFCRFWPECQVYAFEPVPTAYERLLTIAAEFPTQVHPQAMALGDETTIAEMHVSVIGSSGGEQSSSLLTPSSTHQEFPFIDFLNEKISVRVARLEEWAEANNVDQIDFLWLDLQGMELAALQGCGSLLSTVRAIHCEVQNIELYRGAPLYMDLSSWLRSRGFSVVCEAVFRRGGNVLFARL
jgi:FkbM family methyltransferase